MSSEQDHTADQPVSVVTGANSGIGRATAIHLADKGHRVIGTVRSIEKADKLRNMAADADVSVELFELDVADDDSVRAGFERILEATGRVDHLVNNAGVGGNAVAEECPPELYLSVMNVNLCGAVRCIQAVLPQMRERGSGTIVNITSVAGRIAALAQSPYVASKWAFEGLSEGLAQELAPFGIRGRDHRARRDQVGDLRQERRCTELDGCVRRPLPADVPVLHDRHGQRDRPVRGGRR